jgi:hypothetical protein
LIYKGATYRVAFNDDQFSGVGSIPCYDHGC